MTNYKMKNEFDISNKELIDVNYDEIEIYNHKVYKVNGKCWDTPSTCVRNTNRLKIYKKKGYIYYSIIK